MRILWVCAAALLTAAGCSSHPPDYHPAPGTLVPGTAQLAVDGRDAVTTEAVQCSSIGPLTTITAGEDTSGATAMVSNEDELTAEIVRINDVGGFTGSYNAGLGGSAEVTMAGRTYDITGTADGFETDNPSFRASGTFTIRVSC